MKNKILLITILIVIMILVGCSEGTSEETVEEILATRIVDNLKTEKTPLEDKIKEITTKETVIVKEVKNQEEAEEIIKEVEENLKSNEKIKETIVIGIQGYDEEEIEVENIDDWQVEVEPYDTSKKLDPETEALIKAMATKLPEKKEPTLEELYRQPLVESECTINSNDKACVNRLMDLKGVWYTGDDTEEGGLGFYIDIKGQNIIEIGYPYSEKMYYIETVGRKEVLGHFLIRAKVLDYTTNEKEDMVIEIKRVNHDIISFKFNDYEPYTAWYSWDDIDTFLEQWYIRKFES